MSLRDELNKYLASPAGKKKVAEERAKALKAGKQFGTGRNAISVAQARRMGEKMRELYYSHLPVGLQGSISPYDIIVGEPKVLPDGSMELSVSIPEEKKHRDSLAYPGDDQHGAYDIIGLLTFGWNSVSGRVRGEWHGNEIWNRTSREPDGFMQRAVEAFNREFGEAAFAELNDRYEL